jgi:hypothetical protein
MNSFKHHVLALLSICALLPLFGCSGSGSTPTAAVSGSVLAGPAANSTITVKGIDGKVIAGPVTSGADGSFTINIPTSAFSSDLIFEASGGTFPDEAKYDDVSGKSVPFGALSAFISASSLAAGSNVTIDPSSTIIRRLISGGRTKSAAETVFNTAFGYTPDCSLRPAFANISTASTDRQRLFGLRVAAFSQLTKDLINDPAKQFELIEALAEDLSDGVLDGKKSGVAVKTASGTAIPEDIANRFVTALMTFQTSPLNKSRLTPDRIDPLPFSKTVLTTSYKVEYIPGTMAAAQGKTSFKIRVANRSDGTAAAGKTLKLVPYMYMATKSHTSPVDPLVVDNGDGTYSCTVYYVMSSMMNGVSMGIWELKVLIGSEAAYFYPVVAMPMGTTTLTKLSGINDAISGMAGIEKRTYFLFNDGFTAATGGTYNFGIFLATKETMTSFPAVIVGSQLKDQNKTAWTVNTITVQLSTDNVTWIDATDKGNGHWSATGLTGLSGTSGKIYVKVTVNGEQKTTDGSTPSGTNGYQTFTVML